MANFGQMQRGYHETVIANGGTQSPAVNIGHETIMGFIFPASFEGATVTLQAARAAGGTYVDVKDPTTGSAVTINAGAAAFVPVPPQSFACLQHIKITSASSVGADRTVIIVTRPAA